MTTDSSEEIEHIFSLLDLSFDGEEIAVQYLRHKETERREEYTRWVHENNEKIRKLEERCPSTPFEKCQIASEIAELKSDQVRKFKEYTKSLKLKGEDDGFISS